MRMKLLFVGCIAVAGLCAVQAEPDGLIAQEAATTSEVEQELIETLNTAFEQAMVRYRTDVTSEPDAAMRLNEKLYEAQIQSDEQKRQVVGAFLSRAKEVEKIAKSRLDEGRGTSTALLEAKAARLKAMRELAALQQ